MQVPPAFSAIKINGERAYDIAREGEKVELVARPVTIRQLQLVEVAGSQAVLEARCGKGTYVRALARDLGRVLGCFGHVTALRRTRVGPFEEIDSVSLSALEETASEEADARRHLLSVEAGLSEVVCVVVDRDAAARLRRGQPLLLRGRDAPATGMAYAACGGVAVAFGRGRRRRAGAEPGVQSAVLSNHDSLPAGWRIGAIGAKGRPGTIVPHSPRFVRPRWTTSRPGLRSGPSPAAGSSHCERSPSGSFGHLKGNHRCRLRLSVSMRSLRLMR